jgi:hypothetical protein
VACPRILDERRLTLDQARYRLGTYEHPISPRAVRRLITKGLPDADGHPVILEHLRIGREIVTSLEAVRRFLAKLDIHGSEPVPIGPDDDDDDNPPRHHPCSRREPAGREVAP